MNANLKMFASQLISFAIWSLSSFFLRLSFFVVSKILKTKGQRISHFYKLLRHGTDCDVEVIT